MQGLEAAPGGGDGGGGGGGSDGSGDWPRQLTWSSGDPSPTCSGDGCGTVCEGHYCVTRPGRPPVYTDPANNDDDDDDDDDDNGGGGGGGGGGGKEEACKSCRQELKDTYCPINSNWKSCVWNQCQHNKDCSTCEVICEDEVNALPDPTGGVSDSDRQKACNSCRQELKDTYCPVNSNWKSCVWNQCQANSDCSTCNVNCEDEVNKLPDPTGGGSDSEKEKACRSCRQELKDTYCPINSNWKSCVWNQCQANSDCSTCNANCEDEVNALPDPTQ
ncbi:hypothetical protein LIA77_08190 [Sarocladium implicatum]|nr:hypothetical protein LIA77_08190 [Sarocladium implicatum]